MSQHVAKAPKNTRPAVAEPSVQRQSATGSALQAVMNDSAQVRQLKSSQEMLGNSPQVARLQQIAAQQNRTGLPDHLKSGIEQLSGLSMDDVRVHYNSAQPAQLNAHAYAQGNAIHLAPGQEKHLPHEAWHVVQQKQGRVKPTMQFKESIKINDDDGLEKEADRMGTNAVLAVQKTSTSTKNNDLGPIQLFLAKKIEHPVVQRCISPAEIGNNEETLERIQSFKLYAEEMAAKAEEHLFDTEDEVMSEQWCEASRAFNKFIHHAKDIEKYDPATIDKEGFLEMLEENLSECNEKYAKTKAMGSSKLGAATGSGSASASAHKGSGSSASSSHEEEKENDEEDIYTRIERLPTRQAIFKSVKNSNKLNGNIKKIIKDLCQEMMQLKGRMLRNDGNAIIEWMNALKKLVEKFSDLAENEPDQYKALAKIGIIDSIKNLKNMFDGGEMCNEELPKEILSYLK